MQAQKRDANEPAIVQALRAVGCIWIPMDRMAGFDAIVISPRTGTHMFEIKDPAKKWALTPAEQKRKDEVEAAGGLYCVVLTVEQALIIAGYM